MRQRIPFRIDFYVRQRALSFDAPPTLLQSTVKYRIHQTPYFTAWQSLQTPASVPVSSVHPKLFGLQGRNH